MPYAYNGFEIANTHRPSIGSQTANPATRVKLGGELEAKTTRRFTKQIVTDTCVGNISPHIFWCQSTSHDQCLCLPYTNDAHKSSPPLTTGVGGGERRLTCNTSP